jgi:fructose-1,6-bisphosphatase class II
MLDSDLSLEFLRVVERAAIASAETMGQGDGIKADRAAVEAMRQALDSVPIDGTIVIGEGERDKAPMLFVGEKVGIVNLSPEEQRARRVVAVDLAVDPLEGTRLCATGAGNAIAVLAASERGGFLHAPDLYMEKLIVGPSSKHAVHLDAPVSENLKAMARCLERDVKDLVIVVLERDRHEWLIEEIRSAGARIRLIPDGDLAAGIAAAVAGSGVHAVMGTGAAREGVLTAAAMRCLNGEIFGRLVVRNAQDEAHTKRLYRSNELASGQTIMFAATGVTDGTLMKGVRFFGDGTRTSSLVMQTHPHRIRFVDSIHVTGEQDVKIRF